jgi:DNA-directed RNA polymerase subunit M/transcription elongation factor TFIIS
MLVGDNKDKDRLAALDVIMNMVYPGTSERILNHEDKELGMEIARMLKHDPNLTLEFLQRSPNRESILWFQNALEAARKHSDDEVSFMMAVPSGIVGVFTCPFCRHQEVAMTLTQRGSGDEGMTTRYTCVRCGRTWGGR